MKPFNTVAVFALSLGSLLFSACEQEKNIALIDSDYKLLSLHSGGNIEVPVISAHWNIAFVEDLATGEKFVDHQGAILSLDGFGEVQAANGWFALSRQNEQSFELILKENFDQGKERQFRIHIQSGTNQDDITIVQQTGSEYKLVKTAFVELEEQRLVYTTNEDCKSLVLTNNTDQEVWKPTGSVFEHVAYSSTFKSDDYGAFDWARGKEIEIVTPELIIDGMSYSRRDQHIYTNNTIETPYIKDITNGSKVLLPPFYSLRLSGEATYCDRAYNYTFTIENVSTGSRFNVIGTWTNRTVLSTNTIASDY